MQRLSSGHEVLTYAESSASACELGGPVPGIEERVDGLTRQHPVDEVLRQDRLKVARLEG